jgi:hypothetical protein
VGFFVGPFVGLLVGLFVETCYHQSEQLIRHTDESERDDRDVSVYHTLSGAMVGDFVGGWVGASKPGERPIVEIELGAFVGNLVAERLE